MRNITKTSKQAQIEKDLKKLNTDNRCPECNELALGIIATKQGFFKTERMHKYKCFDCGCEWNTGWRKC